MWCLKTIKALNEAAVERSKKGESIISAFSDVGINKSSKPKETKTDEKMSIPLCERE